MTKIDSAITVTGSGPVVTPATAHTPLSPSVATLSLRVNFVWALVGNVVFAACQWAAISVLAKLSDAKTVGQFALALAITGPIFLLTNLQLGAIQATDAKAKYCFGHYLALRILGTAGGLLILSILLGISGYDGAVNWVVVAVGLGKACETLSEIAIGLVQRHERLDRVARGRILAGVLSLLGLVMASVATQNAIGAAFGWAAGHALAMLLTPWWIGSDVVRREWQQANPLSQQPNTWKALQPRWETPALGKLFMLAWPLGFVMMLVSLYFNVPRYFIEQTLGEERLGIFAAIAYLMVAGHTVLTAAGQTLSPRFAKQFSAGELSAFCTLLARMSLLTALGGTCGVAIAWWFGEAILRVLYTAEYASHQALLVALAIVAAVQFLASIFGVAMTSMRLFIPQIPLLLTVVLVTALACYWLVPSYGLLGAAYASGIGAIAQLAGCMAIVCWALIQRTKEASYA